MKTPSHPDTWVWFLRWKTARSGFAERSHKQQQQQYYVNTRHLHYFLMVLIPPQMSSLKMPGGASVQWTLKHGIRVRGARVTLTEKQQLEPDVGRGWFCPSQAGGMGLSSAELPITHLGSCGAGPCAPERPRLILQPWLDTHGLWELSDPRTPRQGLPNSQIQLVQAGALAPLFFLISRIYCLEEQF